MSEAVVKTLILIYNVSTPRDTADAAALCQQKIRPGAHHHPLCFALQFGEWHNILSRARKEKNSDTDTGEDIATKEVECSKKAFFEVKEFCCTALEK